MPAESASSMDLKNYEVKWKKTGSEVTVGLVKEVDPGNFKLIKKEKRIGKVGVKVDDVVQGFQGSIRTVMHQVDKTVWQQLCPWWTSGSVPMAPTAQGFSQYDNSAQLRLHPVNNADASHDLVFTKAFPNVIAAKGDGENWRELVVEWDIYMDQSVLLSAGTIAGAYIGDAP